MNPPKPPSAAAEPPPATPRPTQAPAMPAPPPPIFPLATTAARPTRPLDLAARYPRLMRVFLAMLEDASAVAPGILELVRPAVPSTSVRMRWSVALETAEGSLTPNAGEVTLPHILGRHARLSAPDTFETTLAMLILGPMASQFQELLQRHLDKEEPRETTAIEIPIPLPQDRPLAPVSVSRLSGP